METFLEILKYTLPAFITFGATYFVLRKFLDNEHRKQLMMLRKESQKETTPIRLQAFERIVLFLERSALDKLVIRVHQPGMGAKLLQQELVRNVNDEFNHNLAQQIYISSTTWSMVKQAKDETVKVINMAGAQMQPNATGADLGQKIFEIMMKLEHSPTEIAIMQLKKEIRQIF
jgi:hypothetical protein